MKLTSELAFDLDFRYLDNVEVFCPGKLCSGSSLASYPFQIVAPVIKQNIFTFKSALSKGCIHKWLVFEVVVLR